MKKLEIIVLVMLFAYLFQRKNLNFATTISFFSFAKITNAFYLVVVF